MRRGDGMTTNTDFLALYQQLQLEADCSIAELKHAYRRRVAELHPDRQVRGSNAHVATELQELTATYAAAMAFARRHGRLPGAAQHAAVRAMPAPLRGERRADPATPAGVVRPRRALLGLAILTALAWALLPGSEQLDSHADPPVQDAWVDGDRGARQLDLGMSKQQVRAREGPPSASNEWRWEYGTSWVEFENGRVNDWYSSPLRPLHVATRRAADRAGERR